MTTTPTYPTPDCKDCPSFLRAEDAPTVFNRSTGSPMCGSLGKVLGKPGATPTQDTKLRQHIAASCPKFGEPRSPQPERNTQVMLPDPELRDPANINPASQVGVTSCAMCRNFVPEITVAGELGWTTGLCAAKGKLLFTNRLSAEARDCEFRMPGVSRGTTGGLHFLPEYNDAFLGGADNSVTQYRKMKESGFIEPGDWPTDRAVSEEDMTAGVKAWRRYSDPAGSGNEVWYPIFDAGFFDDDDREMIPKTGSDEHPELYVDHFGGMYFLGVAWFELDETPMLSGVPGTGKTELLRHAAWIMQVPFRRLSITADTETDDVIGKYEYDPDKGTVFRYGALPEAWTRPGVLCIDEPNVAKDPGVWHEIRPLTDNSKQMVIRQHKNERLDRNTDCFMGMCINPSWDQKNVGAMEVGDADINRLFHLFLDLPPEELEREIIKERVKLDGWELDVNQMNSLMKTATDIRGLSDDMALPITWALRPQIKVARALRWFEPITAYRRAVGDYLEPEAQQVLLDQVRANWGDLS